MLIKFVKYLGLIVMHIFFLGVILVSFWPIANWYLNHRPILGVDFYHTITWIKFFKENLHLFQQNYIDFWYAGEPIHSHLVMNWFRVYSLIARFFPLISAIKFTSLAAYSLMVLFVYLGTYKLSKNPFISGVLSILVVYSSNMYGSLTWGGSLPYFANQLFFPFLLWTLASFLESSNRRWYYLAILVLGFAITGHIASASAFGLPTALILIVFGMRKKPVAIKTRLKEAILFIIVFDLFVYRYFGQFWFTLLNLFQALLKGLPLIKLPSIGGSQTSISNPAASELVPDINEQIATFYRNIFYKLFTDTNQLLLVGLGLAVCLFVLALVIGRTRRNGLSIVAWTILSAYVVLHVYLNANGVVFLNQGWYRAFWQFPIAVAFLIASLAGASYTLLVPYGKVFAVGVFMVWTTIAGIAGYVSYINQDSSKTISILENQSSPSSAYPEALNLFKTEEDFEKLKLTLLPVWMDAKDKNYRFFSDDAQVIVWWNSLFDIPQVRGYLDPPGNTSQHHLLDQAIAGGGLVENYKYPEDIARNMALYYLDWYAIKYFEGGHVSQSPNKAPSTYLVDKIAEQTDVETQGVYFLHSTKSGKPEIHEEVTQYLKYYRFKDEVTSPIASISNAPTLACFCDFPAYESLIKILSMHNINSTQLVSLYIPDEIDKFSGKDLRQFDAILLSNYRYQNRGKTFNLLGSYLENGGKLILDTGGEVKESKSTGFPEWFPFSQSLRGGLGKEWSLDINSESEIVSSLDITDFDPPVFDNLEWNFSYPASELKPTAQVLLSQRGKPLLVRMEVGKGTLYWSGMNLIYHIQYYTNVSESQLFANILESLISLDPKAYEEVKTSFLRSNVVDLQSQSGGKGILVKRQMYDTWSADINGRSAKMIKAGPSFPGFIYIPLQSNEPFKAQIRYIGLPIIYLQWVISLLTGLFLLDLSVFNGFFIAKHLRQAFQIYFKRTTRWWEKEE